MKWTFFHRRQEPVPTPSEVELQAAQQRELRVTSAERRHREAISRRAFAHSIISDMDRLRASWENNRMTETQPLTVMLDEPKIKAITKEFNRLLGFETRMRNAATDWELYPPAPQMAMGVGETDKPSSTREP